MEKVYCRGVALILLGAIGLVAGWPMTSYAQDAKKVKGLNFSISEDWPVEKRGGLVAPIPTEEYVSIKFKAIEEEFQAMKEESSQKFMILQTDLEHVVREIQSQKETLSLMKILKTKLDRLDGEMTNKMDNIQTQFKEMNEQIKSLGKDIKDLQRQIYTLDEKVDYEDEDR